ncbi:DUF1206 domain-containing protein [Nocardioides marinquilinus]|uniref:DUF1206 domain-containing protein n=1 Tax=Nocardioides marinquilinus TaxID=1210400 RepID=A0ABP9PW81_9ACTN
MTPTSGQAGQAARRGKAAADRAQSSDWTDRAAAAGFVAFGVVHLIIGWLALSLALGDREGSASSTGAFAQLAEQPFGKVLVWLLAVGMVLLAGWQALEAAVGHRGDDDDGDGPVSERTRHRLLSAGKAVVYLVIAISAVRVATGSSSGGSGGGSDSTTAKIMDMPGGQVLVGLIGLGIVAVGIGLLVIAYKESYLEKMDGAARSGRSGTVIRWLGRLGHVAKGVSLGIVGGLFLYAAFTHEADKSGGLDQALRTVLEQPYGPVLLGVIAVGYVGYGVFCLARARHHAR